MRWGKLLDRWHDEGRIFHLLRDDGAPACGVPYYTSTGAPYPGEEAQHHPRCGRCERIAAKATKG